MSGSSAIASARRRRTVPAEPINQNNQRATQNTDTRPGENNVSNKQQVTPLELLKQHEEKIDILGSDSMTDK